MNLRRYDEAKQCYDTTLDIMKVIFDGKGYAYAVTNLNLARIYDALGQYDKAIESCDEVESTLQIDRVKKQPRSIPLAQMCREFRAQVQAKLK